MELESNPMKYIDILFVCSLLHGWMFKFQKIRVRNLHVEVYNLDLIKQMVFYVPEVSGTAVVMIC